MARPNCKLVSRYSYDPSRHAYHVSRRSQTVPDMNYSIRTLLDRYQRNPAPVDLSDRLEYDEVIDTDEIKKNYEEEIYDSPFEAAHVRDLTDISDAKRELREIKKEEKRKRMERDRLRKAQANKASREQGQQSKQSPTSVGDGESPQK